MGKLHVNYVVIIMKIQNIFFLHCTALQETRININGLQQPLKESIAETISDFFAVQRNN